MYHIICIPTYLCETYRRLVRFVSQLDVLIDELRSLLGYQSRSLDFISHSGPCSHCHMHTCNHLSRRRLV